MAAIKTLYQGDSLSIGFSFGTYDVSRIENAYVYINEQLYPSSLEGSVLRCVLKSEDTKRLYGTLPLMVVIDDSIFGIRKTIVGNISFISSSTINDASINQGYNISVTMTINEESTAVCVELIEAFRGYSAYDIYVKYTTDDPILTESEWNDTHNDLASYKIAAEAASNEAEGFAGDAEDSAAAALISEQNAKGSELAAEGFKNTAGQQATISTEKALESFNSAAAALVSEQHAKTSEDNAKGSETASGISASNAAGSAITAGEQATIATNKASEALNSAQDALDYKNAAAAIVSGGPRGVYETLAALIAANPDHQFTYVATDNGNWYYWNGSTFVSGGVYQAPLAVSQTVGTSETDVMSQKAVTEEINNVILLNRIREESAEKGVIYVDGEIEIFEVESNYRVQKLYLLAGDYYVRVCKPGSGRGCWKYTDNTYTTPVSEIWGNEPKRGVITLEEGYYVIAWEQTSVSLYDEYAPLLCIKVDDFLNLYNNISLKSDFYVPFSINELIYDDGTIVSSSDYQSTDFIPVEEGDIIITTSAGGASASLLSGYSDRTQSSFIITTFNYKGGFFTPKEITSLIPRGVKYIKVCHSSVAHPETNAHIVIRKAAYLNSLKELHKGVISFPYITKRRAAIMFQMDCNENFYNSNAIDYFRLFEDNGIKSTFVVLPEHLSDSDNVNILDGLYANGNEFAIHTDSQFDVSATSVLTDAQFRDAMATYIAQMSAKGYNSCLGLVPLGADIKASFATILDDYLVWALTENLDYAIFNSNYASAECSLTTPPRTIKRLALESLADQYTAEYDTLFINRAKEVIDSTITNGGYLIFYGHTYKTTSGTTYTVREEVLKPIVEYVKAKIDDGFCISGNTSECLNWYYSKRMGE